MKLYIIKISKKNITRYLKRGIIILHERKKVSIICHDNKKFHGLPILFRHLKYQMILPSTDCFGSKNIFTKHATVYMLQPWMQPLNFAKFDFRLYNFNIKESQPLSSFKLTLKLLYCISLNQSII